MSYIKELEDKIEKLEQELQASDMAIRDMAFWTIVFVIVMVGVVILT